jgi:hypothetical protein
MVILSTPIRSIQDQQRHVYSPGKQQLDGNTITWQTQPTTATADQILIPHTDQPFLDLTDIDVKSQIDAMRTNGNYGFMLNLQSETIYTIRQFCSPFHPDASKHPKLVIEYQ